VLKWLHLMTVSQKGFTFNGTSLTFYLLRALPISDRNEMKIANVFKEKISSDDPVILRCIQLFNQTMTGKIIAKNFK
jgi:hypothetical protein